jgi:integrase/recombinase XerC
MTALDLRRMTAALAPDWAGYLVDWDCSLRAANYPTTTRYNYLLAAAQLGRYLGEHSPDPDADAAADDPAEVTRAHVQSFQAWMIQTRSASTALNKHKALQQFFKWLEVDEEEIDQSPMRRIRQPKTPTCLIPVIRDEDTKRVLAACGGKSFVQRRDEAIIRMLANTGARLSEVANLDLEDVDLALATVLYNGKGAKQRRVRLGPRTARALSRYLRVRNHHRGAESPRLWLAAHGPVPLAANGIKIMLRRRGRQAGVSNVHAHRWRHTYAHEWKLAGGDTGDLMLLLGWASDDMPRRYGASAAAERAMQTQERIAIGERV